MIRRLSVRLYHTEGQLPNILSNPDSRSLLQFTFRQLGPRPTSSPLIIRYPRRSLWLTCNQNVQELDSLCRQEKQVLELQISAYVSLLQSSIKAFYYLILQWGPGWLTIVQVKPQTLIGYRKQFCCHLSVKSLLLSCEQPRYIQRLLTVVGVI